MFEATLWNQGKPLAFAMGLLIISTGVVLAALTPASVALVLLLLCLPLGLSLLRRPYWIFVLLLWGIAIHIPLMSMALSIAHLPVGAVRVLAAWKETLLFLAMVAVALRLRTIAKFRMTDILVFAFLIYVLIYGVLSIISSPDSLTFYLYGIRDIGLFALAYFAGRLLSIKFTKVDVLRNIAWLGIVGSTWGLLEYWFVPLDTYVNLGLVSYHSDFLNHLYGGIAMLPPNTWTTFGSIPIRRAISIYWESQIFATSFLLTMPAIVYFWASRKEGHKRFWGMALVLAFVALLFTITRASIAVVLVQMLTMLVILGRKRLLLIMAVLLLLVLGSAFVSTSYVRTLVAETLSRTDLSTQSHLASWENSIDSVSASPWFGYGPGTADLTAVRFGREPTGGESQYFKVLGELGFVGLGLYLSMFLLIIVSGLRYFKRFDDPSKKGIVLLSSISAIGLFLNNLVAPAGQTVLIIYIFWWLAGAAQRMIRDYISCT